MPGAEYFALPGDFPHSGSGGWNLQPPLVSCVPLPASGVPLSVRLRTTASQRRSTVSRPRTTSTQRAYRCLITRYHANSGAIASTLHDLFAAQAGSALTHDATVTMCEWIPLNAGRYHHYSCTFLGHSRSYPRNLKIFQLRSGDFSGPRGDSPPPCGHSPASPPAFSRK